MPPTEDVLRARQREALESAFGADAATLDAEWHAWVAKQKD